MCGIYCALFFNGNCNELNDIQKTELRNRGPNCQGKVLLHEEALLFYGFVLWQQGSVPASQPLENDEIILLLNGDIFNADKSKDESDSTWLLEQLTRCTTNDEIIAFFHNVRGPFSLIFYRKSTNSLYFGRDSLGRNSLLMRKNENSLTISSSLDLIEGCSCIELPPLGLYKLEIESENFTLYPWKQFDEYQQEEFKKLKTFLNSDLQVSTTINPSWLTKTVSPYNYSFYSLLEEYGVNQDYYDYFLDNIEVKKAVKRFVELLENSVKDRVEATPTYCGQCIATRTEGCNHPKVAILFSGGIDCTILASVANKYIPENQTIDLLNVAFEKVNQSGSVDWNVPDRISAQESFEELKKVYPNRCWNLLEINVTRQELNERLCNHIKHLIYPLNTILDESLGCVFWFASRALTELYTTPARVILIGSGADELFGGYVRHRNAFTRCHGSYEEKLLKVEEELEMDWQRIPSRNLGRDDRVIADNAKTSRSPFIEEAVVSFVRNLSGVQRCCMDNRLPEGVGDKLFLRLVGYHLGLRNAVKFKKRAAQFGSKIADKKQNAKDTSKNLI